MRLQTHLLKVDGRQVIRRQGAVARMMEKTVNELLAQRSPPCQHPLSPVLVNQLEQAGNLRERVFVEVNTADHGDFIVVGLGDNDREDEK